MVKMKMIATFLNYAQLENLDRVDEANFSEIQCDRCKMIAILSQSPPPELKGLCFNNNFCLFGQLVELCTEHFSNGMSDAIAIQKEYIDLNDRPNMSQLGVDV
jgi:hypothetical protein